MNINIEKETLLNDNYRKVIYTDEYQQIVLMSLLPGEDIPIEIHDHVSQFIRIEKGNGIIKLGKDESETLNVSDGSAIVIPKNTYHHVINVGLEPLKLYTIYSPPKYYPERIDKRQPKIKTDFTGHKDADILVMLELDDKSLLQFCKTNKYIESICEDENFWKRKVFRAGAKVDKPDDKTWKEYYFYKFHVPEIGRYNNYTYTMYPNLKQFLTNTNYFKPDQIEYIQDLLDKDEMNLNILLGYIVLYMLNQNMIFYDDYGIAVFRPDKIIKDLFNPYYDDGYYDFNYNKVTETKNYDKKYGKEGDRLTSYLLSHYKFL